MFKDLLDKHDLITSSGYHSYEVAAKDLVGKVCPVQVPTDGKCMFHAACKALAVADKKDITSPKVLSSCWQTGS